MLTACTRSAGCPMASKAGPAEADDIAAVRDAKFKRWLQNKTLRDKTFDYLEQLDNERAKERESLKDVAVSLCAVDRLLGTDDAPSYGGGGEGNNENDATNEAAPKNDKNKPPATQKTMRGAWTKWAMEHHTFDNVPISKAEVAQLTRGALENLEANEDGSYLIPSLKVRPRSVRPIPRLPTCLPLPQSVHLSDPPSLTPSSRRLPCISLSLSPSPPPSRSVFSQRWPRSPATRRGP